ncbi:DUF192 domain-containing protein [bacterium]|nr:DUF192 domain-containing protein [bacterium]
MRIRQHSRSFILLLAVGLLACSGCREHKTAQPSPAASVESRPGRTAVTIGPARLWVEVVDDEPSRAQGLMFRRELPDDEGMLFVFERPQPLSFWMRNTYLPLDIAFLTDELRVLNIEAMRPLDEGPRYRSRGLARYAVETNQGWFKRNGVKPGDTLSFR